jgi:putative hydrolase of the HAD superfamily
LSVELRPQMVEGLRRCHQRLKTALLTNNFTPTLEPSAPTSDTNAATARQGDAPCDPMDPMAVVSDLFDVVVESSKVGLRKPDPAIYTLVCELLAVRPHEAVLLDDLGVNLKPARAMGMTTIKVDDPDEALAELEAVVGFPVR